MDSETESGDDDKDDLINAWGMEWWHNTRICCLIVSLQFARDIGDYWKMKRLSLSKIAFWM